MTTTVRYKDVRNTTGAVFTASNFTNFTDGDDKQKKQVKRTLAAIDVGTESGKTQSTFGVILDVIPATYNVLWVNITVTRPTNVQLGGSTVYKVISNGSAVPIPTPTIAFDLVWYVDSQNCLRLVDNGEAAGVQLEEDDIIDADITLGQPTSALDTINP